MALLIIHRKIGAQLFILFIYVQVGRSWGWSYPMERNSMPTLLKIFFTMLLL